MHALVATESCVFYSLKEQSLFSNPLLLQGMVEAVVQVFYFALRGTTCPMILLKPFLIGPLTAYQERGGSAPFGL